MVDNLPLMPHQEIAIKKLLENRRFLLADEPGLGKSRVVLEAARERVGNRDMLILCPNSIVHNWNNEIKRWGFPERKVCLVGYKYWFLKDFKQLLKRRWGVIVADEADALKNWEAQTTRRFRDLLKGRDSCVWLVTGTPIRTGAQDLHPLLSFIQPGTWGTYKEFCQLYCKERKNQWKPGGIEYYGMKNEKILAPQIQKVMLRRYKKDEVKDLPDKIVSRVPLQIGSGTFDIFTADRIIQAVMRAVEKGGQIKLESEVVETLQDIGLMKVEPVYDFIKDTLGNLPLVVFAHHRAVAQNYVEKFADDGRAVTLLLGGMSEQERARRIADFQAGKYDVIVCGLMVAGVGINLFRASHCVVAELPWTQAALDQAADRLHRIGQKNCVNVYYTYGRGTFEEVMLRAIEERKYTMKELIGHAG